MQIREKQDGKAVRPPFTPFFPAGGRSRGGRARSPRPAGGPVAARA
jgi:hypothetical protein